MADTNKHASLAAHVCNNQRGSGGGRAIENTLDLPHGWVNATQLGFAVGDSLWNSEVIREGAEGSSKWLRRLFCFALLLSSVQTAVAQAPSLQPRAPQVHITSTPLAFDPAMCRSGDKAYVYWAAGDQVFKFPFNPDQPILPVDEQAVTGIHLRAKMEIPPAPNPSEPQGCRDNPLRGLSVPYMTSFEASLYQRLFGRSFKTGSQGHGFFAVPKGYGRGTYVTSIEHSFKARHSCRVRSSKILHCLTRTGEDFDNYSSAHVLRIDAFEIDGFTQNQIYFLAQYDLAPSNIYIAIKSSFVLFGSVLLSINPTVLPREIDSMAEYHRELVGYLVKARVAAYSWASRK